MTHLCFCAHERTDHLTGVGLEKCTHRVCGCDEFRLDPRSSIAEDPGDEAWLDVFAEFGCLPDAADPSPSAGSSQTAATTEGAA